LDAALRGAISAATVALLLAVAQRWGRSAAGLLAGLPTVTGPALVWLALDQGPAFAAQAAVGAVAAAAPCAVFAWGYAWGAARSGRRLGGLLAGAAQAALTAWAVVWLLEHLRGPVWPSSPFAEATLLASVLAASSLVCLACLRHPAGLGGNPAVTPARTRGCACRGIGPTAAVSGLVSALVSLLAPQVGALWAGMLSSPPLLAAALAWLLHGQGGLPAARQFLRSYTVGLVGRSAFAVAFSALLAPAGLWVATGSAVALALLGAWSFTRLLRLPNIAVRPSQRR